MGIPISGPVSAAQWAEYHALPEWEITAKLTRAARFRVRAASPQEAEARFERDGNGILNVDDLYDGYFDAKEVVSVAIVEESQ